jgi:ribosomal protein S14
VYIELEKRKGEETELKEAKKIGLDHLRCTKCGKEESNFPRKDWNVCRECYLKYYADYRRKSQKVCRKYYPQNAPNICKICQTRLNVDNWHKSRQKEGTKICKICGSKRSKEYREKNKHRLKLAAQLKHPEFSKNFGGKYEV